MLHPIRGFVPLCLLIAACGESAADDAARCTERHPRPLFAGCVISSSLRNGTPDGDGLPQWALTLTGEVVEQGRGEPPGGCARMPAIGHGLDGGEAAWSQGSWFRVRNEAGDEAVVALVMEGRVLAFPSGDTLALDFAAREGGFGPSSNQLTVRGTDGALLTWLATGGGVDDLDPPPELTVRKGAAECGATSECVRAFAFHALTVSIASKQSDVPYGDFRELGAYDVWNGGLEVQTGASSCPDAFAAYAAAGAFRR